MRSLFRSSYLALGALLGATGCNLVLGIPDFTDQAQGGGAGSSANSGGAGGSSEQVCVPGVARACPYTGDPATEGKGICHAAKQTCAPDGLSYGPCDGTEQLPLAETCANLLDDDCDGAVDDGCLCTPDEAYACYGGPVGTEGVGICHAGTQLCGEDGHSFGACMGEQAPLVEDCATPEDDDCDGTANQAEAGCVCAPGMMEGCYEGPAGTQGVGVCAAGMRTCDVDGKGWGACAGQVLPGAETCADANDEDCDGYDCAKWALLLGDQSAQYSSDVAVDSQGNIIVVGTFSGAVQFSGNTLIAAGDSDVFLAKFDPAGKHLWSKQFGDVNSQVARSVAVDATGNIILGGFSNSSLSFGGGMVPSGAFVVKLSPNGQHVWSKGLGGGTCGSVESVAVAMPSDVVVAGAFCGTINFGDGAVSSQGANADGFVAKLRGSDGSGKISDGYWSKVFGDSQSQYALDVAVDSAGNIFVAGDFQGAVNLGLGLLTSAGDTDIFLAKLSPSGSGSWHRALGDADIQHVYDLAVDGLGAPILTGSFKGKVDFGAGVVAAGSYDGFVVKYSAAKSYQWAVTFSDGSDQTGKAVAVDAGGNVFVTGNFGGSVNFGTGALVAKGTADIFLAKLTSAGAGIWSRRFGDATIDSPVALGVTPAGEPVLAGYGAGAVDLGTGPLTSSGSSDAFIAKFAP